jgi:MFS family permease
LKYRLVGDVSQHGPATVSSPSQTGSGLDVTAIETSRYRWTILAAGTTAQVCFTLLPLGMAVMLPALRSSYGLSLSETGLLVGSINVGTTLGMLPWGLAADRIGERIVVTLGLGLAGCFIFRAADSTTLASLAPLLLLASFCGASVSAASGRAIMYWFGPGQRGFALAIRQASPPIAGVVTAVALPSLLSAGGVHAGWVALAAASFVGAIVAGAFLREGPSRGHSTDIPDRRILRDGLLWRFTGASALIVAPQFIFFSYTVLFLHDHRDLSGAEAAFVFAGVQVFAVTARIVVGRWSDRLGSRFVPLLRIAIVSSSLAVSVGLCVNAPLGVLVALLIVAGGIAGSGNGASLAAAAEIAGHERSGTALGMQQTAHAISAALGAYVFALLVASVGWGWAFGLLALGPVAGYCILRRLNERLMA